MNFDDLDLVVAGNKEQFVSMKCLWYRVPFIIWVCYDALSIKQTCNWHIFQIYRLFGHVSSTRVNLFTALPYEGKFGGGRWKFISFWLHLSFVGLYQSLIMCQNKTLSLPQGHYFILTTIDCYFLFSYLLYLCSPSGWLPRCSTVAVEVASGQLSHK